MVIFCATRVLEQRSVGSAPDLASGEASLREDGGSPIQTLRTVSGSRNPVSQHPRLRGAFPAYGAGKPRNPRIGLFAKRTGTHNLEGVTVKRDSLAGHASRPQAGPVHRITIIRSELEILNAIISSWAQAARTEYHIKRAFI